MILFDFELIIFIKCFLYVFHCFMHFLLRLYSTIKAMNVIMLSSYVLYTFFKVFIPSTRILKHK